MVWPMIAAGAGAGLSAIGGIMGAHQEKKATKKWKTKTQANLKLQEGLINRFLPAYMANLQGGFTKAQGLLANQGASAKKSIKQNQTQAMGGMSQGLVSSGLYNSTLGANLARGIASDTSSKLAMVDESLAQMYSNLELQKTQAIGGAMQLGLGLQTDIRDKWKDHWAEYYLGQGGGGSNTGQILQGLGGLGGQFGAMGMQNQTLQLLTKLLGQ